MTGRDDTHFDGPLFIRFNQLMQIETHQIRDEIEFSHLFGAQRRRVTVEHLNDIVMFQRWKNADLS